jgi:hypothetical protein
METIHGVQVEMDAAGNFTQISIDLREHEDAIPKLKEMGLLPVASKKENNRQNGHTVEQFMEAMEAVMTKHYGNNY